MQEVRTCQRGKVYRSLLVRESYRVGKQVKTRILCNLTRMPVEVKQAVRAAGAGEEACACGRIGRAGSSGLRRNRGSGGGLAAIGT
ncbi:hypothetical protein MPNT_130064 [Candidatus Methylacidithermus pantelleriae]|uniref:Uncharacterized protein n=1 Tax=Candidatus Methylacidithermus pantelleriae TaxID=2744239 RepID=A0A8J2BRB1_9BACT|nr:hypothetical protein MPNT_130064 [Candidatus Methylacidithermus pantelleriae]